MNFLNLFKKQDDYDVQFLDYLDLGTYASAPPVLAKNIKALKDHQINKNNNYNFAQCPGMFNYASMGYIIPSWATIWIKSNSAATKVFVNLDRIDNPRFPRGNINFQLQPGVMDLKITDGFTNFKGVKPNTNRLAAPWKIHSKPEISFLFMPAYFHNPIFNNQIRGYPGVVDVDNTVDGFSQLTFIFSVLEKFEHTIQIGDPLLHVIPFIRPKEVRARYGFLEGKESHAGYYGGATLYKKNFYRRFIQRKKKYTLDKSQEIIDLEKKNIGNNE